MSSSLPAHNDAEGTSMVVSLVKEEDLEGEISQFWEYTSRTPSCWFVVLNELARY